MNFDIERERTVSEILSIEDFGNVDPELLEKINNDPEYRKLFEELKELSGLVKMSDAEPTLNGVSLHDSVLSRVKSGDTAPRYIYTAKKYPFASVACLVIVCAVVLFARSGIAERFSKKSFNAAENGAVQDFEYFSDSVTESENAAVGISESSGGAVLMTKNKDSSLDVSEAIFDSIAPEAESNTEEYKADLPETQNYSVDNADGYAYTEGFRNNIYAVTDNTVNSVILSDTDDSDTVRFTPSYESATGQSSVLSESVLSAIERALKLGADINGISAGDILKLGEEKYLEWLETLWEVSDFKNAYTYDAFLEYCKE